MRSVRNPLREARTHRPLELLFLGCQGDTRQSAEAVDVSGVSQVLDVMATLSNLAVRASAFATEYPECLHWKYRRCFAQETSGNWF